ncbi:MAG: M56 family metallopeptidase [Gammaproteobacteria bacterium]|nr:M56 family metallopeptidase [Gammaproteobacteria bacterium]
MLINESAILLNLLNIALMGLLAATALLVLFWPIIARHIEQLSACAQQKMLWLFVATPWAASCICVFVFVSSLFQSKNSLLLGRLTHWHHPYVFHLDSWHSATLFIFILGVAYVLARKGLTTVRHLNTLNSITRLSQEKNRHWEIGRDIVVLESQTPSAFAAGFVRPKCYVTTGLIERVTETELDIIIEHERAHIKHRDTQKKLLFALFTSLYPKPVARRLNRLLSVAMEQLADAHVSKSYCAFDIAETLVKAARTQHVTAGNANPLMTNFFTADDVDLRVRALVAPQAFRPFPWGYCLLLMALTSMASSVAVDGLHHLIEAVFSH